MLAFGLFMALLATIAGLIVVAGTRPARRLPEPVRRELTAIPTRRWNNHLVDLELRDGRVVEDVSVAYGSYVALVGGRMRSHRYSVGDVVHARSHSEG